MQNIATWPINKNITFGLRDKLFLLLIVSVLAVLAGQSFEDTVRQVVPEQGVFRSVVNKKASGLSALLTIANQSGLPCRIWLSPYRRLSEVKGLLYVVQPDQKWTAGEVKDILAWVRQGNQLIYFDSFFLQSQDNGDDHRTKQAERHTVKKITKNILLHQLGLSAEWLDNNDIIYDRHLPEMAHVNKLLLKAQVKLVGGQPLVACKDGAYITSVKQGAGRVLIGTVPGLCSNEMLSKPSNYDNFQFMVNCFDTSGDGIIFDESCHGIKERNNVFVYFSRRLPGLICFQLFFMLVVYELSLGQRFGALRKLRSQRQISDLAYVSGLANVYKRAQANLVALEIIVGFWKTKLCRQLGLSTRASVDEILDRAKDFDDASGKRGTVLNKVQWLSNLQSFLNEYEQALSEGVISKARVKELISRCDALAIKLR